MIYKQTESTHKRNKIIKYWNDSMLCSLESSTSHGNPDLMYLDNAIENMVLEKLLGLWKGKHDSCLDIGAGYGRFTNLFKKLYGEVVLIEPSENIYKKLHGLFGDLPNIYCHNIDFETYSDKKKFDLIFASGVLYLYDGQMLNDFATKIIDMLADRGLFVIRDFISVPDQQILKSRYIEEGFCYYRTPAFWSDFARLHGFELLALNRSRPDIQLLRNRYILTVMHRMGLTKLYRYKTVIDNIMRLSKYDIKHRGIQTVFIGMRIL